MDQTRYDVLNLTRSINMAITHNLGYPRIGAKRELKFALEDYWKGNSTLAVLEGQGAEQIGRAHV